MRINENSNGIDIFVCGMSGSGKDTIINYLVDYFGYRKSRIAETIKRVICEQRDLTFDELEIAKRENKEVREDHHKIGDFWGSTAWNNRVKQLATRRAYDFHEMDDFEKSKQIGICDVRTIKEAKILLEQGFVGIFLSRLSDEYKRSEHETEQDMFSNGTLIDLINTDDYGDRCVVIFNGDNNKNYPNFPQLLDDFRNKTPLVNYSNLIVINKSTEAKLLQATEMLMEKYFTYLNENQ